MTEQLQKMAESHRGVWRTGSFSLIGARATSVPREVGSQSRSPRSGARVLHPTRTRVVGSVGGLTRCFGWLTGLGDAPIGQSPKVMNNVCLYIYIYNIYIEPRLTLN
jgi:hypothetical protein